MSHRPPQSLRCDQDDSAQIPAVLTTELRTDPLSGRQVILAAARSARPSQGLPQQPVPRDMYDPFLEGHEHDTPDESLALRKRGSRANAAEWLLRVVPNRFPAVTSGEIQRRRAGNAGRPATGVHEVVIECPDHRRRMSQLSVTEIARILVAWQQRVQHLIQARQVQAISIFRNEGAHAGASLPHCHSQILATNFVNDQLQRRVEIAQSFVQNRTPQETCPYQQWLQSELTDASRIIVADSELAVVCPFASRCAWHVRFSPGGDQCGQAIPFSNLGQPVLLRLAALLLKIVQALHSQLGSVDYNLTLILPPATQPDLFPWMLDLLPRTGQFAGFELLTESDILTLAPEAAAETFRDVIDWNHLPTATDPLCPQDYHWQRNVENL